jgi:hypothetical protein
LSIAFCNLSFKVFKLSTSKEHRQNLRSKSCYKEIYNKQTKNQLKNFVHLIYLLNFLIIL